MANFEDKNKEQLAEAERFLKGKANTLGKDGHALSEPFVRSDKISATDILMHAPTASDGLVTPNYDDYPSEGAVGTRYVTSRLYSYLPSGLEGPSSIQTFMTVTVPPDSHNPLDVEDARLKPLIATRYSQGKANAAHSDTSLRGFELALYPAISGGGPGSPLVADTSNGPISPAADPSAGPPDQIAPGIGDEGFWTVDYDAGIVRFSHPPLNGPNGVMNPNNVFGDIEGLEVDSDAYGVITMFATYYRYTGDYGIPDNLSFMTVGDGYVSHGIFTGVGRNTIQAAIEELPDSGGTVFIKEGEYFYTEPVIIPKNISIVGLNGVKIHRPPTEPAFAFVDGYSSIEGVEIQPYGHGSVVTVGGAIELRSTSASQIIKNVKIKDCVLYGEDDAPAIAFNCEFDCTYAAVEISGNLFECEPESTNAIYIGERTGAAGFVTLAGATIENNTFQATTSQTGKAIDWNTAIRSIDGLKVLNNNMSPIQFGDVSVNLGVGNTSVNNIDKLIFNNNRISGDVNITYYNFNNYSNINSNSIGGSLTLNNGGSNSAYVTISDNSIGNDVNINLGVGGDSVSFMQLFGFTIVGNTCSGDIVIEESGNSNDGLLQCTINDNEFQFLSCPRLEQSVINDNSSDDGIWINTQGTTTIGLESSSVSGNQIGFGDIRVNNASTTDSTTAILNATISGNQVLTNIDINGQVTESTIIGNSTISGGISAGNITSSSVISDNSIEFGSITAALISDSIVNNNKLNSGSITITSGSITSTIMDGNNIGSSVNFTDTSISKLVFANNNVGSTVVLGGVTVDNADLVFNSNVIGSTFTSNGLTNCIISGNVFKTGVTFATANDINATEIVYNNFGSSVTVTGKFLDSKFTDGYVFSAVTFSNIVTNSHILNNRVRDAFSISAASTVSNSQINGNIVSNSNLIIGGFVFNSGINNNRAVSGFSLGEVNNCKFTTNIAVSGSLSTGVVNNNCIFSNNSAPGFTLGTISNSTFDSNRLSSAWTSGTIFNCILSNNIVEGSFNISSSGDMSKTYMIGNNISGTMLWTGFIYDNVFENNVFSNSWQMSNIFTNNTITSNRIFSFTANDIVTMMNYSNNYTENFTINNLIQQSILNDGYFSSTFSILNTASGNSVAAVKDCVLSSNFFGGALSILCTHATALVIDAATIVSNSCMSTVDIGNGSGGSIDNLIFSNNNVLGATTFNQTLNECVIANNSLEGTLTFGATTFDGRINKTAVTGNACQSGTVSNSPFIESSITGNSFYSGFRITIAATVSTAGQCLLRSVLSSNHAHFGVGITLAFNRNLSSSNTVYNSVISDNTVSQFGFTNASTSFGSKVFLNSVLEGNSVDGTTTITISDTSGSACAMDDTSIVGNAFQGTVAINSTNTTGGTLVANSNISSNTIGSGNLNIGLVITGVNVFLAVGGSIISWNDIQGSLQVSTGSRNVDSPTSLTTLFVGNSSQQMAVRGRSSYCVFSHNTSTSSNAFLDNLEYCTVNNNSTTSTDFTFGRVLSTNIVDNNINGLMSFTATDGYAAMRDSIFSDNKVVGDVSMTTSGTVPEYGIFQSTISGNSMDDFTITYTSNVADSAAVGTSVIDGNMMGNFIINSIGNGSTSTSHNAVRDSFITDNIMESAYIASAANTYVVRHSIIRSNKITSGMIIDNETNNLICSNTIIGENMLGYADVSGTLLNTKFGPLLIGPNMHSATNFAFNHSILHNNRIHGFVEFGNATNRGAINASCIDGNKIDGYTTSLRCGAITGGLFTGNIMTTPGQVTITDLGAINGAFFTGNYMGQFDFNGTSGNGIGVFTGNDMSNINIRNTSQNLIFVGNITGGLNLFGDATDFVFNSNLTGGTMDMNQFLMTNAVICGNDFAFGSGISEARFAASTISGNVMGYIQGPVIGDNAILTDTVIANNVFSDSSAPTVLEFVHSTAGSSATMTRSQIVHNIFARVSATVSLGSTGGTFNHPFDRSSFSFNYGNTTTVTIFTNVDTNITGLHILGNMFPSGSLIYTNTGTTSLTVPSTTASVDFYMAFNMIPTYTRFTFTANNAIGWHGTKNPGAASTNNTGSNQAF